MLGASLSWCGPIRSGKAPSPSPWPANQRRCTSGLPSLRSCPKKKRNFKKDKLFVYFSFFFENKLRSLFEAMKYFEAAAEE